MTRRTFDAVNAAALIVGGAAIVLAGIHTGSYVAGICGFIATTLGAMHVGQWTITRKPTTIPHLRILVHGSYTPEEADQIASDLAWLLTIEEHP